MTVALNDLPQSASVEGFWKLEEASGTRYDETANSYDLTDVNSVGQAAGKDGYCGDFSGSKYLYRTNPTNLNPSGDFTVAAWIKTSDISIDRPIATKYGTAGNKQWWCGLTSNKMYFVSSANGSAVVVATSDTATLNDGAWHLVVFRYTYVGASNSVIEFFLDGSPDGSDSSQYGPIYAGTATFRIGKAESADNFLGQIDEVAFWDLALTDQEISDLLDLFIINITADPIIMASSLAGQAEAEVSAVINPIYSYFNKELLAVFPQMGTIEYTMEFPVSIIEFEGGTRAQRVGQWAQPRYRFNWQLMNRIPIETFPQIVEWSEIWEFYKRHRGQEKPFWMIYGFPIPDINVLSAPASTTNITVTAIVGLTTEIRAREGRNIHLADANDRAGEINQIVGMTGAQAPYGLTLANPTGANYDNGKMRFAYEVIWDEENLEIESFVELALSTGLRLVTP